MTDFDFEELDKAVNTALGTSDTTDRSAATPAPQTPREETPVAARPVQAQPAPAMRRSSGRFMDVVHPSSDMRTSTGPTRGVTLNPISNVAPEPAPVQTPNPTPDTSAGDLLDDFDWNAPLDSPFLPDAQVEKRPLGGSVPTGDSLRAALENETQLLLDEPDEPRLEAPDELQLEATVEEHTMPDPIDFAESALAPEAVTEEQPVEAITDEVLSTEIPASSEPVLISTEPINSEVASDSDLSHAAALDAESHFVPGAEEVASSTIGDVAAVEEHTGPVSITQQYSEKPAEAAVSGAIYDTENYHQPITTPVKKKSGAWVILWILLILVVGGGGGAAFYFFVLPSL